MIDNIVEYWLLIVAVAFPLIISFMAGYFVKSRSKMAELAKNQLGINDRMIDRSQDPCVDITVTKKY